MSDPLFIKLKELQDFHIERKRNNPFLQEEYKQKLIDDLREQIFKEQKDVEKQERKRISDIEQWNRIKDKPFTI